MPYQRRGLSAGRCFHDDVVHPQAGVRIITEHLGDFLEHRRQIVGIFVSFLFWHSVILSVQYRDYEGISVRAVN